jgi:hypothetical protein
MAAEITISASLELDNGVIQEALSRSGLRFDQTGVKYQKHVQNIGTSEEAIDLGEVTSLGYCLAINLDNTNYVELRSATGAGNDIIKLPAKGGLALFHWGSDVSAPFAVANTAACNVAFLIAQV